VIPLYIGDLYSQGVVDYISKTWQKIYYSIRLLTKNLHWKEGANMPNWLRITLCACAITLGILTYIGYVPPGFPFRY